MYGKRNERKNKSETTHIVHWANFKRKLHLENDSIFTSGSHTADREEGKKINEQHVPCFSFLLLLFFFGGNYLILYPMVRWNPNEWTMADETCGHKAPISDDWKIKQKENCSKHSIVEGLLLLGEGGTGGGLDIHHRLTHYVVVVKKKNGARARMPNNKTPTSRLSLLFSLMSCRWKKKESQYHNKQSDVFFSSLTTLSIKA